MCVAAPNPNKPPGPERFDPVVQLEMTVRFELADDGQGMQSSSELHDNGENPCHNPISHLHVPSTAKSLSASFAVHSPYALNRPS
jgi:hypothetical protein